MINRTNVKLIALTALLAVNAVHASDSWSQQLIGSLFSRESAKIMVGVTGAAIVQGTAQRFMTERKLPDNITVHKLHDGKLSSFDLRKNQCITPIRENKKLVGYKNDGTPIMGEYTEAVLFHSVLIGLWAIVITRIRKSPLNASDVIKPVAVGMGIVAGSYALASMLAGMNEDPEELDLYTDEEQYSKYLRYASARDAYTVAARVAPLVVMGVGAYLSPDDVANAIMAGVASSLLLEYRRDH